MKILQLILVTFMLFLPRITYSLTIKTYAQDYPPKFFQKDGAVQGYGIDIISALEKADPEIKFVGQQTFASVPRIETELLKGEIDAFVGAFKSKDRLDKFSFIEIPLHLFQYMIAVRKDDPVSIKSYDDIRKLKENNTILALLGTRQEDYLNEQEGLVIDAGTSSFDANVNKLLAGRARFLLGNDLSFQKLDQKKIRILPTVFRAESQYIMVSKLISNEKLVHLTKALKKLNDEGKLKAIFKSYQVENI